MKTPVIKPPLVKQTTTIEKQRNESIYDYRPAGLYTIMGTRRADARGDLVGERLPVRDAHEGPSKESGSAY